MKECALVLIQATLKFIDMKEEGLWPCCHSQSPPKTDVFETSLGTVLYFFTCLCPPNSNLSCPHPHILTYTLVL